MSTRAQVRFATREEGVTFSEHPEKIHAQFYVHSDGYPEGLGVEIAESVSAYGKIMQWEIEDLDTKHGDLEYIYYIWQASGKTTWISIFEVDRFPHKPCRTCGAFITKPESKCIFVGEPHKLIQKYKINTNYDG
tara:strand:+ start:295 stop:696 length:402 start_codon:yes stop_codon:yes gene_type:complete